MSSLLGGDFLAGCLADPLSRMPHHLPAVCMATWTGCTSGRLGANQPVNTNTLHARSLPSTLNPQPSSPTTRACPQAHHSLTPQPPNLPKPQHLKTCAPVPPNPVPLNPVPLCLQTLCPCASKPCASKPCALVPPNPVPLCL